MTPRKKVLIGLRLEGTIGRRLLTGILSYLDTINDWDIRFAYGIQDLKRMSATADGLLVDQLSDDLEFRQLPDIPTPIVRFNTKVPSRSGANQSFIHVDDGAIGMAAADYLLQLGSFRSFAFIPAHGKRFWSDKRGRAFAFRLRQNGHNCHCYVDDAETPTDEISRLAQWIKALPKPIAFFAAWDSRAVETLEACRKARVVIPRQAVLIGVDNDEITCEHAVPPLTSIEPDTEREGYEGAKLLDLLMKRRHAKHKRVILGPVKRIVERMSTRPPAPAAQLILRALDFIKTNAVKGIHPGDVATHVGVSRSLLDLRFRELEGKTISEHLRETRLALLASLIRRTRRPLSDLTRECGFASLNSAKEIFHKRYGMSMRDYRKADR